MRGRAPGAVKPLLAKAQKETRGGGHSLKWIGIVVLLMFVLIVIYYEHKAMKEYMDGSPHAAVVMEKKGLTPNKVLAELERHLRWSVPYLRNVVSDGSRLEGISECALKALEDAVLSIRGKGPCTSDRSTGVSGGGDRVKVGEKIVKQKAVDDFDARKIANAKSAEKLMQLHGIDDGKQKKVVSRDVNPPSWNGPPLLDPNRHVISDNKPRMRAGWKYENKDNTDTIFVSVASFRDSRCPETLYELFSKAKHPKKITVGIVQQNSASDVDCFTQYCRKAGKFCRKDNVKVIRISASESTGVMVARHLATTMFSGQQYFLQLDAHNLMAKDWDMGLIQDLKKIPYERTILSHHPPASEQYKGWRANAINICKYKWDGNGLPRFSAQIVRPRSPKPFPSVFAGAGMVFSRSELLIDCPWDRHLPFLFSGEELLLAACAWSHGWNLYNPSFVPAFHFYKNAKSMIPNPTNGNLQSKSLRRLKYMLGVLPKHVELPPGEFQEELNVYGMGNARSLLDYWEYADLDWVHKPKSPTYKWCDMSRPDADYTYHNTIPEGLPPLDTLSFDSGVPKPDPLRMPS